MWLDIHYLGRYPAETTVSLPHYNIQYLYSIELIFPETMEVKGGK